jgi:CheY-like chemotaxis protein
MIEKTLIHRGHEVMEATNGVKALRLLEALSFDLVITDLIMPEMDGLQPLREVCARPSPHKVIVISGGGRSSAADYLQIATNFGAAATLTKPFLQEALTDTIERVLTTKE